MVKKKPGKWFQDENIQRITVKEKNIYIGKKYILEKKRKKRPTLSYQLKKIKRHVIGWSQEKITPLGLLSYNAKSAPYWVEQIVTIIT